MLVSENAAVHISEKMKCCEIRQIFLSGCAYYLIYRSEMGVS